MIKKLEKKPVEKKAILSARFRQPSSAALLPPIVTQSQ